MPPACPKTPMAYSEYRKLRDKIILPDHTKWHEWKYVIAVITKIIAIGIMH
jgi:hypothetical protein